MGDTESKFESFLQTACLSEGKEEAGWGAAASSSSSSSLPARQYNYVIPPPPCYSSRRSVHKPLTYKMGNSTIRFQKPLVAAMAVVFAALLVLLYVFAVGGRAGSRSNFDDQYHGHHQYSPSPRLQGRARQEEHPPSYNATYPLSTPTITERGMRYRVAMIADLDEASKVADRKDTWRSYLKRGHFFYDSDAGKAAFEWDEGGPVELTGTTSSGGRGMELSELVVFDGKLLTVDDRTGIVYQVDGSKVIPWQILSDGPGTETKGFKSETGVTFLFFPPRFLP